MKKALVVLLATAAGLAAQASGTTGSTAPKTRTKAATKSTAAPQPLTIPADAVKNAEGSYNWTDKQGKKWIYVNSPFGVIRSEAQATSAPTASSLDGVKAFDEGDKVRFEKASPFGPIKWEKNKTDLNDDERGIVNSQTASQNAKQD
jgi:hypothetical protein